ncbi:thioesterase II family protein [Nocardiopsis sp. B62]|uniref:thioesterase II family protein n=1 Tax=Nocardiopsis sp. B62 TaxID=2824874 RepID=UPI001B395CDB|nr:alpha/beta fold hydrolase [Nocardiopsis sp. B62]MBQ1082101.1 thioesterase [Nocardiopsis sp. B62]
MTEFGNNAAASEVLWELRSPSAPGGLSLLILPHAGGNAHYYAQWEDHLPRDVGLLVAQYPGRGSRFTDDLPESVDDLVAPIVSLLAGDRRDLVVLGHSMGTLVAYEVARGLSAAGRPPVALIGSACRAPFLPNPSPVLPETLSDEELVEAIKARGGTDHEILDEPELREIILPSIRADFSIDDAYRRDDAVRSLHLPLTIVGGESDPIVPVGDLVEWRDVTQGETCVETLPGGHFYFDESEENLARFMEIIGSVTASMTAVHAS